MTTKIIIPSARNYIKGKFTFLFFSLILLFLIFPFIPRKSVIFDILFTLLLLSAIRAFSGKRKIVIFAAIVVFLDILLTWSVYALTEVNISLQSIDHIIIEADLLIRTFFFIFTATVILTNIMKEPKVTMDTIFGSFCVYFLMALIWSHLFSIIEFHHQHSFGFNNPGATEANSYTYPGAQIPDFIYYSFVTLTTLGYGDIVPLTLPAKIMAALEAVMGQLYLTVLVARLVGLHISAAKSGSKD